MATVTVTDADLRVFLETAVVVAKAAGQTIRTAFHSARTKSVDTKGGMSADLVTETDKAVEAFIFEELRRAFPSHRFPYVCVSIGLTHEREPIVGVVYNPILDQLFTASKGKGAHLNGTPISVKSPVPLNRALIAAEYGADRSEATLRHKVGDLHRILVEGTVHGVRSLGSAALNLCYVASGGVDLYYEFGIHIWDVAAGVVLVREAGGVVIDTTGEPLNLQARRLLAVSCPSLIPEISRLLTHVDIQPHDN